MAGLIVFDPDNEEVGLSTGDDVAVNTYLDIQNDNLYFTDGLSIYSWDNDPGGLKQTYTWRSGEIRMPSPVNMGAAIVEAELYAETVGEVIGDAYIADVVLCAGFDGINLATAYTEVARDEPGVFLGNAQLDTTVKVGGTASLLLDGTGDVVQFGPDAASAAAYDIGAAGTATVEGFVNLSQLPSASQRMAIIAQDSADVASFFVEIYNNAGTYQLRADFGNGNFTNTAITITPSINQWYHFAVQFVANSYMEFMWTEYSGVGSIGAAMTNYAFIAKQGSGPETLQDIGPIMTVGGRTDGTVGREFNGRIDSIRFTNGTRRYTTAGNRLVPDPVYPKVLPVAGEDYDVIFRLYSEGVLKHTQTVVNDEPFRLPGGYLSNIYSVEIESALPVNRVSVAENIFELAEG